MKNLKTWQIYVIMFAAAAALLWFSMWADVATYAIN